MEKIQFDDYEDFAYCVADTYETIRDNDDLNDIAIIAKYESAKEIIQEIIHAGFDIHSVEIGHPDLGYDDEYIITICNTDENEGQVWCEPMVRNGKYINDESVVVYIMDDCSSKVISHCNGDLMYEVAIGEDNCDCHEYDYKNKQNDIVSKSTDIDNKFAYTINNKEVDKKTFDKTIAEIEDKYLNKVKDILVSYCDMLEEINECRKMFK